MTNKINQDRLLIATFIVATFVAIVLSDVTINITRGSIFFYLIGALLFGLLISAAFSFTYIMVTGYLLRYSKRPASKWLVRMSEYLYNLSVSAYIWVILILAGTYLLKKIDESVGGDGVYSTIIIVFFGIIIFIVTSWKDIAILIKNLKKSK